MGQATARVIPLPKKKGFGDALKATKTTEKKAPAKKERSIELPDDLKTELDRFYSMKKNVKQGTAEMKAAQAKIFSHIMPIQDEDGFANRFSSSYAVKGHKETGKYVSVNKFSINAEDDGKLAEILGESYSRLIEENSVVRLKAAVFEDEELQEQLMELIGDAFGTFFETATTLKVSEGFNEAVYREVDEDGLAQLRVFMKQTSASLR